VWAVKLLNGHFGRISVGSPINPRFQPREKCFFCSRLMQGAPSKDDDDDAGDDVVDVDADDDADD
jgi:hypothetical protein